MEVNHTKNNKTLTLTLQFKEFEYLGIVECDPALVQAPRHTVLTVVKDVMYLTSRAILISWLQFV